MKLWLFTIGVGLCAGTPCAAAQLALNASPEPSPPRSSFDLRLVEQPWTDPSPVHQSGMIAEAGVAAGVKVGVGLFSARRNTVNLLEPKTDARSKPSRKVGLSLRWRF